MKTTIKNLSYILLFLAISLQSLAVPLSGVYTINSAMPTGGTNYISFSAAVTDVTANGVSGPVTFLVAQGTYTEQVAITFITGASATNSITFKANPANTSEAKIEYNAATSASTNYVIQLNGTSHILFDSLTVSSTTGLTYGTLIDFISTNNFISIKNCVLDGSRNKSNSDNFALINKRSGGAHRVNNLTVANNRITGGSSGINMAGSSSLRMAHFDITNNTFLYSAKNFVALNYCSDALIENNYCEDDTTRITTMEGISVRRGDSAIFISKNTIKINSPTATTYGIRVNYLSGRPNRYITIENNMISMAVSTGFHYGLKIENCIYQNIYHNSIQVNSSDPNYSLAFELSGIGAPTYGKTNIVNNIFSNAQGRFAFSFRNYNGVPSYIDSLDHNIYNSSGTPFKYEGTSLATFAAFRAASGKDVNSLFGDPGFVSSSDLHLVGTLADNAGDNSIGVTTDIDGDSRPIAGSTTVDIGADEYGGVACPPLSLILATEIRDDSATISWLAGPGDISWIMEYGAPGFTPGTGTSLNSTSSTAGIPNLSPSSCYDVYVRGVCTSDTTGFVGPYSFCTPCSPLPAPYFNDMATMANINPPTCWLEGKAYLSSSSRISEGYSAWTSDDFGNIQGTGFGAARSELGYSNINDWLVSPVIDLGTNPGSSYQVEFKIAITQRNDVLTPAGGSIALDDKVVFLISTDYGTTWSSANILRQWDTTDLPLSSGEYFAYNLSANGYTGPVRFAFYTESTIANVVNEVHIDDFSVSNVPTCPEPSLFTTSASTLNSATFGWTNGSNDVSWVLEHGPSGFTLGTGTITAISNAATAAINGLASNSLFDVYLRSICGAGDTSRTVGPLQFTTLCAPITSFCEDFSTFSINNSLPVCWTSFNNSTTLGSGVRVESNANNAISGTNSLAMSNGFDITSTIMAITPQLSNLSVGNYRANFFVKATGFTGTTSLVIGTMSNPTNPGSFNPLDTVILTSIYQNFKIDFSAYTGADTYISLLWLQQSTNDKVYIDDFCWEEIPTCDKVAAFSVLNSGIDSTQIDLGWNSEPTHLSHIISYGAAGYIPGIGTELGTTTSTSNFHSITGLSPNTEYCFWLKSICANGDTSLWQGPACGSTGCPGSYSTPFYENFNSYSPVCWEEAQGRLGTTTTTFTNTSSSSWSGGSFANAGISTGANVQVFGTNQDEWLITPSIDLGSDPNVIYFIEFDYALTESSNTNLGLIGPDDTLAFVISYDDGATWNQAGILETWTNTSTITPGGNSYVKTIRNTAGKVKFGFYGASSISNNFFRFHIDNFSVRDTLFLDITEIEKSRNFKVFPNPTQGLFNLVNEGNSNQYRVSLMDIQGRIIENREVFINKNQTEQFDLSQFSAGIYTLQIIGNNKTEQHRIVVQ